MGFFNSSKQFQVAAEGNHQAALAAVIDIGEHDGAYGKKDQIILVYILDEIDEESGESLLALQYATKSLDEKANLTKVIKAITGAAPKEGFELEDLLALLGKNVSLTLTHVEKDDRTRAKIVLVSKSNPKAEQVAIPEDWQPPKGLTKDAVAVYTYEAPEATETEAVPAGAIDDSDIPF